MGDDGPIARASRTAASSWRPGRTTLDAAVPDRMRARAIEGMVEKSLSGFADTTAALTVRHLPGATTQATSLLR